MLERILEAFATSGLSLWGPFALLIFCGVGLPIPEDIILIAAGYLGAGEGHSLYLIMLVMYVGIVVGDSMIFSLGHFVGRKALRWKLVQSLMTPSRMVKAEEAFKKYGTGVIFVGRFLPGLRAPIFFTAGFLKFTYPRFLLMDGFAALISAPLFVFMGHWAGENDTLHLLKEKVGETQAYLIAGALVLGLIAAVVVRNRGRNAVSTASLGANQNAERGSAENKNYEKQV